jgi:predicted TIM-barrel fold metal-dependent hydrolase
MDAALAELRWARDHGACAVFVRGLETDRRLSDPYFFPLYEKASSLDVPICPHSGNGSFVVHDHFTDDPGFVKFKLATVSEFHALIWSDVPGRFPNLRFGFIELSAQWVPYVIHDVTRRLAKRGRVLDPTAICRDNRLWVACQTDDDLGYVLKYTGDDHLIIGSDYGHNDTSSEIYALQNLKQQGDVSPAVIDKILGANARALYAI